MSVSLRRLILLFPIVLLLVAPVCSCGAQTAQEIETRIERIENGIVTPVVVRGETPPEYTITEFMAYIGVPAVSVAVINEGEIEWARAWGLADVESGTSATTRTLFQAASISKPVAAMAALKFVEEGRLELDGDINRYLVSWKLPENEFTREEPVTLRHLLTHSGGLTVHGFPGYARSADIPSVMQILDGSSPANTAAIRVDIMPGSTMRYSGGGYTIMQQMLIDIAGKPFPEILRETVLVPVGMELSTYEQPLPPDRAPEAATGYRSNGQPVEEKWHVYPEMAAAGLWTTPTDLARLALEVQRSHEGGSNRILSREMTGRMLERGHDWGLGFGITDSEGPWRFEHGGSNEGFRAHFVAFVREGQGAFVMTNSDNGRVVAYALANTIAREYGWSADAYKPREIRVVEVSIDVLRRYEGSYRIRGTETTFRIWLEEGSLFGQIEGEAGGELHPISETTFLTLEEGTRIRFEVGETGRAESVLIDNRTRADRIR